jgi:hypothetical protein
MGCRDSCRGKTWGHASRDVFVLSSSRHLGSSTFLSVVSLLSRAMARPPKGRNSRRGQENIAPPGTSGQGSEPPQLSEAVLEVSSPLTAGEVSPQEDPKVLPVTPSRIPSGKGEAYDEFGEDFDQEDDVDDYALLHPNSPRGITAPLTEAGNVEPMLISPALSVGVETPPTAARRIRFVSPIVARSPLVTPADAPATKRRRKKDVSPLKHDAKGKGCDLVVSEEDTVAAQQAMLQYWSENPLPRSAAAPSQLLASRPEQANPETNSAAIQAYIRDIAAYAERIEDLGPQAIAGLIFHAHSKLQDTLIPASQQEPHILPAASAVPQVPDQPLVPPRTFEALRPALLPSPVIVRPGIIPGTWDSS